MPLKGSLIRARLQLFLAVLLILGGGVGCAATPLPTPAPDPALTQTGQDATKIIPFFTTEADPEQIAVLQELIVEYQTVHPNIEVDIIIASPASRGSRLLTALASGADLGIFEIEPTLMADWAEAGYLLPLDDIVDEIGEDDFVDGSLFKHHDQVYAVPYATSVYALWVRTDLLEAAGLPLPETYDEVLTVAQTMTTHYGIYGVALPAGQNIATVNNFSAFVWQNGADYFDCDGNVAFDDPAALQAIRRWKALTDYAPPGFTTWGFSEQIDAYIDGHVAMAMYGGRLGVRLDEANPDLAERTTVIFPPWGSEKVTLGVWSRFAIGAGTRNQAEAKAFLTWLVSGDRLYRYDMVLPGHMIPPLHSVRAMPLDDSLPYVSRHQDWVLSFYDWSEFTNHQAVNMGSMQNGRFHRSHTVVPWAQEVFGTPGVIDTMLQEITLGGRDEEAAWGDAVSRMRDIVDSWRAAHPDWKSEGCG